GTLAKTATVARRASFQRFCRQWRHSTIRRIDEKRRLTECLGSAPGAVAASCLDAGRIERILDGLLVPCDPIRVFLIGELRSTGKLLRALPRNATRAIAGPGSLKIRISPGRPTDLPRDGGLAVFAAVPEDCCAALGSANTSETARMP